MRGRKPQDYCLSPADRLYLRDVLAEGQMMQRVANRARMLLALGQGERPRDILHWLGGSRAGLWCLWRRYLACGVEAIWDAERSGRPLSFSPSATGADRADGLYPPQCLRAAD